MTGSQSVQAAKDLDRQRQIVTSAFEEGGFTQCETSVLQPADPFLELSGEDIRRRTYVFTDAYGRELCLRPDLTIPTCLSYLESLNAGASPTQRLFYSGLAFRCQRPGAIKPNEFMQYGVEILGAPDASKSDVEIVDLTLAACKRTGLKGYEIQMGDLALFSDFIGSIDMPKQWQERLKRSFWRPNDFANLLSHLSSEETEISGLLKMLSQLSQEEAEAAIADLLDLKGTEPIGGRTVAEITARLLDKAFDAEAPSLPEHVVKLIDDFLSIKGAPTAALEQIKSLSSDNMLDLDNAIATFEKRVTGLRVAGIDEHNMVFATEFGRNLEYYTGFVFEISSPHLGTANQVAGGGRYDNLLAALGGEGSVAAVGAMVRADRLYVASQKEGAS